MYIFMLFSLSTPFSPFPFPSLPSLSLSLSLSLSPSLSSLSPSSLSPFPLPFSLLPLSSLPSSPVNLAVVSLTLSPYNCLLEGVFNQIQCVVNGLPDPTLTFETSFDTVVCPINGSCTIDTVTQGDLTTSNLTFNEVSTQDEGINTCTCTGCVYICGVHVHDCVFGVYCNILKSYCTSK